MNDFLQQFLIESRELADQATEGLLALEKSPRDAALLDAVFRAMHTLKGGAGIVDFFAMERAVHSAEDLLSAARAGKAALNPASIGNCLACIDQVMQWLDIIEQTSELPAAACEIEADRIVARFGGVDAAPDVAHVDGASSSWLTAFLARHPDARRHASVAVRFEPDADCFFKGEDPVARMMALPGLLAFEVANAQPWQPLASLDAFRCNLVLHALSHSAAREIDKHLQGQPGNCEIAALGAAQPLAPDAALPSRAREVLAAQLSLVLDDAARNSRGHLASAARTTANVLRACGHDVQADHFVRLATVEDPEELQRALQSSLPDLFVDRSAEAAVPSLIDSGSPVSARPGSARTLRIDAGRIDDLVRLTGELTVARNAMAHLARIAVADGNAMAAAIKAQDTVFGHLVGDLQRSVLALRVLPLGMVFQRFPRLLREMSENLGKPVGLRLEGQETEADKAIVEMLFEPLLHVVRNAVDHGVESPARRAERGKPREATIEMRATRQGDHVVIEVSDDGGGIDAQRVREVAALRGLATRKALDDMPDAEAVDLVFAPGFSTAAEVTALSGRGVGMDAVRTAVERMGGRVTLSSREGEGTTVRFMLPFSVMMTTVMSVAAGGQMFGVPLDSVVETIRVPRSRLVAVGAAQALVVRDQTIPVFDLARMLGDAGVSVETQQATILVAAFAGQRCGLQVDALGERLDIILKPLDGLLTNTPGIAGTTLLGDGRVLLVLDIAELLQ